MIIMPYLVDTNFFIALLITDDAFHDDAQNILVDIQEGVYSKLYTSDYILDEAVTLIRRKTKRYDLAVQIADMISNSGYIEMMHITPQEVSHAILEYKNHNDKDLTFTDWVCVCQINAKGWHGIISFDSHFDQIDVKRIYTIAE